MTGPRLIEAIWRVRLDRQAGCVAWACVAGESGSIQVSGGAYRHEPSASQTKSQALNLAVRRSLPQAIATLSARAGQAHGSAVIVVEVRNAAGRRLIEAIPGVQEWLLPVHHLAPGSHASALDAAASAMMDEQVTAYRQRARIEPERPLLIATDGSVSRRTGLGAAAWVDAEGGFGTWRLKAATPELAELTAICRAVESARSLGRPLEVVCDSRPALAAARVASGEGPSGPRGLVPKGLQRRLARASLGAEVTFRWVKGHAGDPMNELADRLAVLARRDMEAGISYSLHRKRAQLIVQESLGVRAA